MGSGDDFAFRRRARVGLVGDDVAAFFVQSIELPLEHFGENGSRILIELPPGAIVAKSVGAREFMLLLKRNERRDSFVVVTAMLSAGVVPRATELALNCDDFVLFGAIRRFALIRCNHGVLDDFQRCGRIANPAGVQVMACLKFANRRDNKRIETAVDEALVMAQKIQFALQRLDLVGQRSARRVVEYATRGDMFAGLKRSQRLFQCFGTGARSIVCQKAQAMHCAKAQAQMVVQCTGGCFVERARRHS